VAPSAPLSVETDTDALARQTSTQVLNRNPPRRGRLRCPSCMWFVHIRVRGTLGLEQC
jgi:hypothetical protein